MPYVISDLGAAPCPPPEGCPPGTRQNPKYPVSSATCCKPIPGYVAPPVVPGGITPVGPGPGPEGPAGGPAATAPWYKNLGQYKWYILGGSAVLVTGVVAAMLLRKSPAPATADLGW